eukprot:178327-Pyramimonas_sp.AAC.1
MHALDARVHPALNLSGNTAAPVDVWRRAAQNYATPAGTCPSSSPTSFSGLAQPAAGPSTQQPPRAMVDPRAKSAFPPRPRLRGGVRKPRTSN